MGDGQTVWRQTNGREKTQGPAPIGARKAVFSHQKVFHGKAREKRLNPGTGLIDPGAAARRQQRGTSDATVDPGHRLPPWLVSEFLGTG